MTTVTLRAGGSAPVEVAWERYLHPSLWPGWSPPIRSVQAPADRLSPGLHGTVHGPAGVRIRFVVTDVDEAARTWSWRPSFGPVTLSLQHEVRAEPAGSSTLLRISGPAPVVIGYLPLARWALGRLVRA